nr:hypothetical protein [Tanacetum cinerariifolium]
GRRHPRTAPPPSAGAPRIYHARHAAGSLPGHERPQFLRPPDARGLALAGAAFQHRARREHGTRRCPRQPRFHHGERADGARVHLLAG